MAITFLADDQLPPLPPTDLISRVVPAFDAAYAEGARKAFHECARGSIVSLERALAAIDRDLPSFRRILDFGCGPGRMMRHLGALADHSSLHGVDVDADAVAWCARNIPFASFRLGPHEPPLPYEDESFDLIFNHSVFTHLDEARQDLWLAELRRILAPGAIALLTVHSTRQWNQALAYIEQAGETTASYREQIARAGIVFIDDDGFVGSAHPEWYHSTYHAPWYVHQHWAQFFVVRAYIAEGADTQDMIVLERPFAPDPMLRPIGSPESTPSGLRAFTARRRESGPAYRQVIRLLGKRYLRGNSDLSGRVARLERKTTMLRTGEYQLGQRTTLVERELRSELDELRARLDGD